LKVTNQPNRSCGLRLCLDFQVHSSRLKRRSSWLMQLVCQRNSLNLRGFTVQEIAESSGILNLQKSQWGTSFAPYLASLS
jgi:hypothetical protein